MRPIVVLCILFASAGCRRDLRLVYSKSAPIGGTYAAVSLYEPYPAASQRLRISAVGPHDAVVLFEDDGMDVDPCFAAAAWSPDALSVAVLVRNCYGGLIIRGLDLRTRDPISLEAAKELLRREITATYEFAPGWVGDPYPPARRFVYDAIEWAQSEEARARFAGRHHP